MSCRLEVYGKIIRRCHVQQTEELEIKAMMSTNPRLREENKHPEGLAYNTAPANLHKSPSSQQLGCKVSVRKSASEIATKLLLELESVLVNCKYTPDRFG